MSEIQFSKCISLHMFGHKYFRCPILEALEGVFITDCLKHVVGHDAIKFLVSVDEEDVLLCW